MSDRVLTWRAGLRFILSVAALLASTAWAFFPVLQNSFVWDDGANLVAARVHWERGVDGLLWAFTRPYNGHYQPLTWLSYRVDVLLSGATPRGVHATNLLLHGIATTMVGALAWALAGLRTVRQKNSARDDFAERSAASLLSAALFALHPIHVETVAWATQRRDLLSTVLVLAAVLIYVRDRPRDVSRPRDLTALTVLHGLAALARAQMSLPFVLLALDVGLLDRVGPTGGRREAMRRLIVEKRFSFLIAAASAAAALWAQSTAGALTSPTEHGLVDRLVQTGYSLAFYPAALLYRPHWLPLYERPYPFSALALPYLVPALAALAGLAALCVACSRRRPSLVSIAFASYVVLVLPVAGPAQSGVQLVADRYAYLATIPLILLAGFGGARLASGASRWWMKAALVGVMGCLLGASAAATRRQTMVWENDETLWRHVLRHSDSCIADNNLGQILFARGEAGPALFHLVRALERVPVYPRPWAPIAAILESPWPDDGPTALWVATTLERAAATRRAEPLPAYTSALAWLRAGEGERSAELMHGVLLLDPEHEGARLALARLKRGVAPDSGPVRARTSPD